MIYKGFDKKNILVFGGNGFLGSHLLNSLSEHLSNLNSADLISQNKINPLIKHPSRINFHNIDITNKEQVRLVMDSVKPHIIFHLAAHIDHSFNFLNYKKSIETNIIGTLNILDSINPEVIFRFIHVGTSESYGQNTVPFNEEMQLKPTTPYSFSKAASEMLSRTFADKSKVPTVFLRLFNLYGEGQSENMLIPYIINSCLRGNSIDITEGKQTRENNYVGDIVNGIIKSAIKKPAIGEVINLGCGEEIKIRDLALKIIKLCGTDSKVNFGTVKYRENEIWEMYCDNTKAKSLLDWKSETNLDEGLIKTIKWFQKYGV